MKQITNALAKLMIGMLIGATLTVFLLIKPISECYELKLQEKDSLCTRELNFRDSVHQANVIKILGR